MSKIAFLEFPPYGCYISNEPRFMRRPSSFFKMLKCNILVAHVHSMRQLCVSSEILYLRRNHPNKTKNGDLWKCLHQRASIKTSCSLDLQVIDLSRMFRLLENRIFISEVSTSQLTTGESTLWDTWQEEVAISR